MLHLVKWAVNKVLEPKTDPDAIQRKIRYLEQQLEESKDDNAHSSSQTVQEIMEPTDCFKKSGTITEMKADFFVIDGIYFVPKALLKNNPIAKHIEENARLEFLAYNKVDPSSGETITKVIKILRILDGLWNDESDWNKPSNVNPTMYYKNNRRREPGKVIAKENENVTVETDAGDPICVNIDKTPVTFVPVLGDYVTLDCIVQMDQDFVDFKGEVLDVVGIEPSRIVTDTGVVTMIEPEGGEIRTTANGTFIYQTEVLMNGYRPMNGDRVSFKAIENEHVRMRCITVNLIDVAVTRVMPIAKENESMVKGNAETTRDNSLWQDKNGIQICGDFDVVLQDGQDRARRTVTIKNESTREHKIIKLMGPKMESHQVRLISPFMHTQTILFPGEKVEYEFEIAGGGIFGRNDEAFVWCFGGAFRIGRWFRITIGGDAMLASNGSQEPLFNRRMSYCKKQLSMLNMKRATGAVIAARGIGKRMNFVAQPLPMYNVPSELFDLILSSKSRSEVINALENHPYCLNEELSPQNYQRIMNTFIYLEEIRLSMEFRVHDIERGHFTPEDSYLALAVANIAEARPSIMVGDTLRASAPWSNESTIYQGTIHKVLHSKILVKFDNNFHSRYNGESYHLQFSFGRGVFRKQHHAIKRMHLTHGFPYLFPEQITLQDPLLNVRLNARNEMVLEMDTDGGARGRILPWHNALLNRYQKQAIVNVLRGEARPMPHIIFGPPGTGKTITIVELIQQLVLNVPSARLIVVTPSNSAAYLITERLARDGVLQAGDFIRLVAMSQVERESVPEHLAQYCATVDVSDERNSTGEVLVTESGLRMKFQAKHIGRHRVTIGTCLGMGALMLMRFEPNHFTHVIIDEAGQAHEADTLIAISQISRLTGSVTLVGDPKQLGPIMQFTESSRWNSNVPLLERLLHRRPYSVDCMRFPPETGGYDPRLVTMLRINYRSIPSVLTLYNEMFYGSCLEPYNCEVSDENVQLLATIRRDILGIKEIQIGAAAEHGFFFCGIDGTNKQSPDSPSWFNPAEACMVHKIVERLYRGGRCGPADIGIITPYIMQVRSIRRIFEAASLEPPKIGSVEEFQGQERKVIIVSTVRSSITQISHDSTAQLGFISQPKRINVALSRAKVALVIVGNPKLLIMDQIWARVLLQALDNSAYCGCTLNSAVLSKVAAVRQNQNGVTSDATSAQKQDEQGLQKKELN
ncbi:probable RNA helicase armi [Anopheles nili]|uniref:probable RNA helicase armi n=1 Tax=Anopheles nili TaxID=185578 RepID=UPI00237B0B28|nr:probable RNA helicase armi [Anopheles nili]